MISVNERQLAQRHLCLSLALEINSTPAMFLEYQSVTRRMQKLKLLIDHEDTQKYTYTFSVMKEDRKKTEVFTKEYLAHLIKRTLKEFHKEL